MLLWLAECYQQAILFRTMSKINFLGYRFIKYDGYGRFGLGMIKALYQQGLDVYPDTCELFDHPAWLQRLKGFDSSRLTISLMPPDKMPDVPGNQWGYSMYEGTRFPLDWAEKVNEKCVKLLTPVEQLKQQFIEQGVEVPIHVIPGGIDPDECPLLGKRSDETFTFMCWGDRADRKGHTLVWRAFTDLFEGKKDARLIIKCRQINLDFIDLTNYDPRVSVWREDVDAPSEVFAACDCFVFPSRGEGWGMPPREAAAMGIPVIATNFMGLADGIEHYANPINTYKLIPSRLVGKGEWAQPDYDELCALMLDVYHRRDFYREKAKAAAAWLRANQTYAHSAAKLIELIKRG